MKVVIITQARMTSTRLPGKVLREVLGRPLLEYQIERLRRVESSHEIVVATTENATDQPIVDLCTRLDTPFYRGSEEDVLARFYGAATKTQADVVVRVTSDCPIIDPDVIDAVIQYYLGNRDHVQYVSNTLQRTYPRGMDAEVFSYQALSEAHHEAQQEYEREHVTPFFYLNPDRYQIQGLEYHEDQSNHRWTVDTPEDFELIRRILESLYPQKPHFSLEDALELLAGHPEWTQINAHVEQKKLGQ